MRLGAMLLVTAAIFAAGCENAELCDGNCPDISGLYSVDMVTLSGACSFSALTLGPTIELQQSDGGRRVFAQFIDPLNKLPMLIAADVSRLEDGEGGSFDGSSEMARGSEDANRLWVTFSGVVQVSHGRRQLSAFLSTSSFEDSCTETMTISGEGPFSP
jgi:hypothetical protein